ncbi:MAG TPA: hypothetical protein VFQ38_17230 [Longimicrobiales bacterium]|nr:hypothetical protein [Longimicrobiales bacterium]
MKAVRSGVLLLALLAGCYGDATSDSAPPPETFPAHLTGSWVRVQNVIGSSLRMTLSAHGATVTGTGSYAIEAGRSGTLAVSGAIAGTSIHLDVAFDYGTFAHFDGTLAAADVLSGGIKYGPADGEQPTVAVTFRKE